MKKKMTEVDLKSLKFFVLVFILSIPFWILGFIFKDVTRSLPIKLPISALMTFCPLLAATILVYKERKTKGVKELLKRAFDFKKIKDKKWYFPIIFLMPLIALLSYEYMKWTDTLLSNAQTSILSAFLFFFAFFIGAIGEEIGWSGYIIDPLQNRYGALKASIILGFVWAIWHIIPFHQAHQTQIWIFWQCIGTIFLRIIMVWIFNNTHKSVFAMVLFHTMINESPFLITNTGSHYDPFLFAILLFITVVFVLFFFEGKTLSRFRYSN